MKNDALAKLSNATRALAEAKTLDEVKKIHNIAKAAETYARAAKLGLEAQNHAAEVKLRAERKAGEMLGILERGKTGPKIIGNDADNSEYRRVLDDTETPDRDASRWQTIAKMEEDKFNKVIEEAKEKKIELTTTLMLKEAGGPLVSRFMGDQENYTPEEIVNLVKDVLGEIDLDPASCDFAQEIIGAGKYFTEEDDGLTKPWFGNVFLNPPYQMPAIKTFTGKLISELPNIKSAILLTNNNTDTLWFYGCAQRAKLICFTKGRINFYKADKEKTYPTNGQAFFYFGPDEERFFSVFKDVGLIVKVIA